MTVMRLAGITKAFGETQALAGLDLEARSGAILGIAGPNGAGKSSLIKILAGEIARDDGTILVDGRGWSPGNPADPVAVVHQEPQVWLNLNVADNLLVGREPGRLAYPRPPARDRRVLEELEIAPYAGTIVSECSLAVRQRTEIARALLRDARFFLFDEPNSALTEDESNRLFAHMHQLAAAGRIVILVSHRLAELVAHCDRVAVIRDGRVPTTLEGRALTQEAIARELVVGSTPVEEGRRAPRQSGAPRGRALALVGWTSTRHAFTDVALEVSQGEIMAVVGVEGSGAREIVASAAGYAAAAGSIRIAGADGSRAVAARTAYLPADRRSMLFPNLSVGENLVIRLGVPEIATSHGYLHRRRLRRLVSELVARFRVRTRSAGAPLGSLSGGNQQKVAIAAAIARRPTLLVLEEPTRGVDVGSKAEIYRILRDFAARDRAVLVYCTEVPEVFELADRVTIVDRGRPVTTVRVADFPDVASLAERIAMLGAGARAPSDAGLSS